MDGAGCLERRREHVFDERRVAEDLEGIAAEHKQTNRRAQSEIGRTTAASIASNFSPAPNPLTLTLQVGRANGRCASATARRAPTRIASALTYPTSLSFLTTLNEWSSSVTTPVAATRKPGCFPDMVCSGIPPKCTTNRGGLPLFLLTPSRASTPSEPFSGPGLSGAPSPGTDVAGVRKDAAAHLECDEARVWRRKRSVERCQAVHMLGCVPASMPQLWHAAPPQTKTNDRQLAS